MSCRSLEFCEPGRVSPPTWAVNAVLDVEAPLEEELRQLVVSDDTLPEDRKPLHNKSGLNGLATNGTAGLENVSC